MRDLRARLLDGMVIPAHPLALDSSAPTRRAAPGGADPLLPGGRRRRCRRRRAHDSVCHSGPERRRFSSRAGHCGRRRTRETERPLALVAGMCGDARQARREAELATAFGYDAGLVSLAALQRCVARAARRTLPRDCRNHSCVRLLSAARGRRRSAELRILARLL